MDSNRRSLDDLITQTETSDVSLAFIGIAMSVASFLIIAGNIIVFIIYFKNKKLQIATNYFIISLAVADVMIGIIPVNFYTVYMLKGKWPFGDVMCRIWLCTDHWCLSVSMLTLMGISFDRYFAICLPHKHRISHTKKNVKFVLAGLWIAGFVIWVPAIIFYPYIVGNNTVSPHQCYIQFIFESPSMTLVTAVCTYFCPVIITASLYAAISHRLVEIAKKKSKLLPKEIKTHPVNNSAFYEETPMTTMNNPDTENNISSVVTSSKKEIVNQEPSETVNHNNVTVEMRKNKAIQQRGVKLMLFVILAFAITWMPYFVVTIIASTRINIPERLWRFCYICGWLNSLLNPLCYACGNKTFKNGFKNIFCHKSRNKKLR